MRDTSDACIKSLHKVLLFYRIFNPCSMTKGRWYEIIIIKKLLKLSGDKRRNMLKYKHINTMHCSLHRPLDFASSRILLKTCPALSWDQALLSFSWVNRFLAGKANRKVSHLVQYLCTWITWACESNIIMIVASLVHVQSRDYHDIRRTLNSTPGPSRPHISWYNTGITSLYSS